VSAPLFCIHLCRRAYEDGVDEFGPGSTPEPSGVAAGVPWAPPATGDAAIWTSPPSLSATTANDAFAGALIEADEGINGPPAGK
jgi:hypothetical protein